MYLLFVCSHHPEHRKPEGAYGSVDLCKTHNFDISKLTNNIKQYNFRLVMDPLEHVTQRREFIYSVTSVLFSLVTFALLQSGLTGLISHITAFQELPLSTFVWLVGAEWLKVGLVHLLSPATVGHGSGRTPFLHVNSKSAAPPGSRKSSTVTSFSKVFIYTLLSQMMNYLRDNANKMAYYLCLSFSVVGPRVWRYLLADHPVLWCLSYFHGSVWSTSPQVHTFNHV